MPTTPPWMRPPRRLANRNAAVEALRTALTQLMAYVESLAVTEANVHSAGMTPRQAAPPSALACS